MSKGSKQNYIQIISLHLKKTISEFTVDGRDCTLWLNPINDTVYISSILSISNIQVYKIDPWVVGQAHTQAHAWTQTQTTCNSSKFAIGSAIISLCAPPNQILWNDDEDLYNMKIQTDNRSIDRVWKKDKKHFGIKTVVVDNITYTKQILIESIIPDIAKIIFEYIWVLKD